MVNTKKIAFVFAGQGAQKKGMGEDFITHSDVFKQWIEEANKSLLHNYETLVFNDQTPLDETRYAQVALFLFNEGVRRHLNAQGIHATHTAGLSLGEYNALVDAQVLSAQEALEIVQVRALAMHQAAQASDTGMMALRLPKTDVTELIRDMDDLYLANHNAPTQCVVGGSPKALEALAQTLKDRGFKRGIPLKTSGAFHTLYMKSAQGALSKALQPLALKKPTKTLYQNVTGTVSSQVTISSLIDHLTQPVLWSDTMQVLVDDGVDMIIEIGPGNVLSKLIKSTHPDVITFSVQTLEDVSVVVAQLKGGEDHEST